MRPGPLPLPNQIRSRKWQQSPSSLKRLLKIKPSMTRGLASFLVLRHRWIDQPLVLDVLDGELMYSGHRMKFLQGRHCGGRQLDRRGWRPQHKGCKRNQGNNRDRINSSGASWDVRLPPLSTVPAGIIVPRFPQRSPPSVLTKAARGGLGPATRSPNPKDLPCEPAVCTENSNPSIAVVQSTQDSVRT